MVEFLFWISLLGIAYCYLIYPVLIWMVARVAGQIVVKDKTYAPTVSVVMSVWNEAGVIENKVKNLLVLDYPAARIDFLIGSDGSTDQTVEILKQLNDPRIKVFDFQERRGKMAVLNELVKAAKGEIVFFCDARQRLAPDAVKELVANLADDKVGCVSGELVLQDEQSQTAQSVGLYWKYEKFIRASESRVHSILGATGAICAIRRKLFRPIPLSIVLDDMFTPFQIIQQGFRAIYDDTAKAYDCAAHTSSEEFRRKVRTLAGNYQIFRLIPQMFNPFQSPVAIQLFSHKFLRLIVPFLMTALFITSFFLRTIYWGFVLFFILQILFYGLALWGGLAKDEKCVKLKLILRVSNIANVFCVLNGAAIVGLWRYLTNQQQVTWEKAKKHE